MAIQARTEFASALNQVCSERGIEPEVVIETIKSAIIAAYRKDYGEVEGIEVDLDILTGEVKLKNGDEDITPSGFGRIAAQTAKQVILQRITEAEKTAIVSEYEKKVGTIISGLVQRSNGPVVIVNLGKTEGIVIPQDQTPQESYEPNQRLKFLLREIREGPRGEEILLSRSSPDFVKALFVQEVPEVSRGIVEIKIVAREPGSRSKVAVSSNQSGVDPVGSCVGQKGVRVQNVISELGDEKIDVIAFEEDPDKFIAAGLSPAKNVQVFLDKEENMATVVVPEDQLSQAIGKDGQNVRLAAKLTGWRIDIVSPAEYEKQKKSSKKETKSKAPVKEKKKPSKAKSTKSKKTAKKKS